MTTEQIALLVTSVVALLQVVTAAITIWNKAHIEKVLTEQRRVTDVVAKVASNGTALQDFLGENPQKK